MKVVIVEIGLTCNRLRSNRSVTINLHLYTAFHGPTLRIHNVHLIELQNYFFFRSSKTIQYT